jgi:hypothetical protein
MLHIFYRDGNTMTLAGSEAHVSGTCYGSSKEGVKRKLPNAALIVEELALKFGI